MCHMHADPQRDALPEISKPFASSNSPLCPSHLQEKYTFPLEAK